MIQCLLDLVTMWTAYWMRQSPFCKSIRSPAALVYHNPHKTSAFARCPRLPYVLPKPELNRSLEEPLISQFSWEMTWWWMAPMMRLLHTQAVEQYPRGPKDQKDSARIPTEIAPWISRIELWWASACCIVRLLAFLIGTAANNRGAVSSIRCLYNHLSFHWS